MVESKTTEQWVPIPYTPGDPQPRISDGIYRGIRADGKGGFEGILLESNALRLPKPEEDAAAQLLRNAGWIVTPPSELQYGCFCDLWACSPGSKPDGCVIDTDRMADCTYAKSGMQKESCQYWKGWTEESLAAYWKDVQKDD